MIDKATSLQVMLNHFPTWMDIRKRYTKSKGGALLRAYNDETDDVNAAIKEYQDLFFLLTYHGKEEDIPAYMYVALIGDKELSSISIPTLEYDEYLTDNVDTFYQNLSTHILYQDSALIIHPSFFKDYEEIPATIEYIIDDTYKYGATLFYQHIWNVFDEFALFSGLERYENESNTELANRVIQQFKNFPNASDDGLKHAIKNALYNFTDIDEDTIKIEKPDAGNLTLDDIYENITAYNKDLFRTKVWDTSLWEHSFKTSDMTPHEWDKEPEEYLDGVGSRNDLHTEFVKNLDTSDTTDVTVTGYKKSRKAISEYIRNNNIETEIDLKLTKYNNEINPKKIEYKITASDIVKVDAEHIFINGYKKYAGKNTYYIEDLADSLDGVTKVARNTLQADKDYQLIFEPTSNYSDMKISKADITSADKTSSLLQENSTYIFKNNELVNKNVLAHISALNNMTAYSNLKNYEGGFTLNSIAETGTAEIALDSTMSYGMINIDHTCRETGITDNPNYVQYTNFTLSSTGTALTSTSSTEATINITLSKCRSFSFILDENEETAKQGAVYVTITKDGKKGRRTIYTVGSTVISGSYNTSSAVEILIEKAGQNPVRISNIKATRYDIVYRLDSGNVVSNAMYTMLPKIANTNTLYVDITSYGTYAPTVKSIHIGSSLLGAKYTIDFHTDVESTLDIDSTCSVTLVNKTDSITTKEYTTKAAYTNTSDKSGFIILNISGFTAIEYSSPAISHAYSLGSSRDYVILNPGETIDKITISGDYTKTVYRQALSSILYDDVQGCNVYVSRAINGFILEHDDTEEIKNISKDVLVQTAEIYGLDGLENSGLTGKFIINGTKNTSYVGDNIEKNFQEIMLYPTDSHDYVGYNTHSVLKKETSGIKISNTFSPVISLTKKYLFVISDVTTTSGEDITVLFNDGNAKKNWTTSAETSISISIAIELDNASTYSLTTSNAQNKYILANEIELAETLVLDGEEFELAEFIITPPDDMQVNTSLYECTESIIVENDGFNKLKYSNLYRIISVTVNSAIVSTSDYELLQEEGIIIWNNNKYIGETASIKYVVKKPISVSFISEEAIYNKVKYTTEAYDNIGSQTFSSVKNNSKLFPVFNEQPDKMITRLTNDNFAALVSDDKKFVQIVQLSDSNKIAIHNGYLYDGGLEYYYFCDKYEDESSRTREVEMINTSIVGDKLIFRTESTNYLPYSSMTSTVLTKLCNFDFTTKTFNNVSDFNALTACDTFGHWNTFNMNVSLVAGINGNGLSFESKNTDYPSYAVLDVTDQIIAGNIISLYKLGSAKIYFCRETKIDSLPLVKDIYIEESNIIEFAKSGDYYYYKIEQDKAAETRYFIMLYGKDCTIDDLVCMKHTTISDMINSHKKNISRLGFEIAEKLIANSIKKLVFNHDEALYDDAEYTSTKPHTIATSMTTGYGFSKIASADLAKAEVYSAKVKNTYIVTEENNAEIITQPIYIKSRNSISTLVVKINDVAVDSMKGFNIEILASATKNGTYKTIKSVKSTNSIQIPKGSIKNYVKVKLTSGPKGQVVSNISVYAEYAEISSGTELISTANQKGTFTSKVYDLGSNNKFMALWPDCKINTEATVAFYYRGARENKNTTVFTDWYRMNSKDNENYNHVLEDYRFVQFKAEINSPEAEIAMSNFLIKVVE